MGSKSSTLQTDSIIFYKDLTSNQNTDSSLKEKVSLSIEIDKCEIGSTYYFSAVMMQDKVQRNLGTSEKVVADHSGKASFPTSYIIEYFFEKNQALSISIFKNGTYSSHTFPPFNTGLGNIIGCRHNTLSKQIDNSSEIVTLKATQLKDASMFIQFKLKVYQQINFADKHNSFHYLISNRTKVYQSEIIPLNGIFKTQDIPYNFLTPGFKIDIINYKGKVIQTYQYQVDSFINGQAALIPVNLYNKMSLQLVNESIKIENISFIDYLKSGVQMNLTIGIDFTGSNGHPLDEGSLHRIDGMKQNDYQRAIRACGDIVAAYDNKQLFPVYGFGALIDQYQQEASMCFNVSMHQDPRVYTINNALEAYKNILLNITFSGPTHFAPIVNQVIYSIKTENNPLLYHILMILTDGIINDMKETIDALVEGSFLPLSVIIIGIGDADFSNMDILDADDNPLFDGKGVKAVRDLVQFVPFSKYEHDGERLAAEVLEEIPRQVVEFYQMNKITPNSIISNSSSFR